MSGKNEEYLQCQYCTHWKGGHGIRVPKSIGKYRIKIIYGNTFIMQCSRCARVSRIEISSTVLKWDDLPRKARDEHKLKQYNKFKGGNKHIK